jgi:hypothetical protein
VRDCLLNSDHCPVLLVDRDVVLQESKAHGMALEGEHSPVGPDETGRLQREVADVRADVQHDHPWLDRRREEFRRVPLEGAPRHAVQDFLVSLRAVQEEAVALDPR